MTQFDAILGDAAVSYGEQLNDRRPVREWTETVEKDNVLLIDFDEMPFTRKEWNEGLLPIFEKECDLWYSPVASARGMNPRDWSVAYLYTPEQHPIGDVYERRRSDGRMMNVIVTARDSQTGTGKTTLAVALAHHWDEHGWTAEKATLDPGEYQDMYGKVNQGAVLILDEAEQAADNRRSMSDQNLALSHLWATMRFKQVSSIITLPTVTMLDKRLKELADHRIHVVKRGIAKVYKVKVEDTGQHQIFEENTGWVKWGARDDDEEYQRLSEKKAERMKDYSVSDDDGEDLPSPQEVEKRTRNDLIRKMNEELTHQQIADIVGLSRPAITQIVND